MRSLIRSVAVVALIGVAAPASAQERTTAARLDLSKADAAVWARDDVRPSSSTTLKALSGSYAVLQALDMYSTIVARQRGAAELNPIMNTSFAQAVAFKAAMGASAMVATRAIAKTNKKAAVIAMVVMNSATAIVVANNMRNARHLR